MAVGAQQLEVPHPVVPPVAVHVVERHGQRSPEPLGEPALLTAVLFEPCGDQSFLQVRSVPWRTEQRFDRHRPRAGYYFAALHRIHEGLAGEAELKLTGTDAVASVVVAL